MSAANIALPATAKRGIPFQGAIDTIHEGLRLVQAFLQGRIGHHLAVIVRQVALLSQAIEYPDRGSVNAQGVGQALNRCLVMPGLLVEVRNPLRCNPMSATVRMAV